MTKWAVPIFIFAVMASGVAYCEEYTAWIQSKAVGSKLKIEAFCKADVEGFVDYELKALKKGNSGKTNSVQKGRVYLEKGKDTSLSRLKLSVLPDDEYEIWLGVFKGGVLVSEDTTFPVKNNQN